MCGILGIYRSSLSDADLLEKLIQCSSLLKHRGPDCSGYFVAEGSGIAHQRLAIIDPRSGAQPLYSADKNLVVAANGEIFNYKEIYADLSKRYTPTTGSDCEVVIPLYEEYGIENFPKFLRGMFSFIIYDRRLQCFNAVRDHIGIIPLYIGLGADRSIWISSEMKALASDCVQFQQFPPGHCYTCDRNNSKGSFTRWYNPLWRDALYMPQGVYNAQILREAFEKAVQRCMVSDVPWGVLLSGGLDSSLVASVASRILKRDRLAAAEQHSKIINSSNSGIVCAYPVSPLHSFCVGLEDSPDIQAAARVAEYLGTVHHSYKFTIQDGINALDDVIYHLETFDTTTIRAATPMYLMSKKIQADSNNIKMILSGEGADEIFGGYLYFHHAPNAQEMQAELTDKIFSLYLFDCLRANKATSAWGLEARVPFLDADFLDIAMNIRPEEKMINGFEKNGVVEKRIEKRILRQAFDITINSNTDEDGKVEEEAYLPNDILWRQKEQFSDGVGYNWINELRQFAEEKVSDECFEKASQRFPEYTPLSKEAYYYRSIFESHYPQLPYSVRSCTGSNCWDDVSSSASFSSISPSAELHSRSIACSTSRALTWDDSFVDRADCSGRTIAGVHKQAYDNTFSVEH